MADGAYGERDIVIDLTVTGARVIRDALKNELVKIKKIVVSGKAGGANGPITLRKESASGSIEWSCAGTTGVEYNIDAPFTKPSPTFKGLYMDSQGTAWTAGSLMIIYTA